MWRLYEKFATNGYLGTQSINIERFFEILAIEH